MIRVAIAGLGKIARDQHLPSIAASPDFELAAIVSRSGQVDGVPSLPTIEALRDSGVALDAVSICTPPQVRFEVAETALRAGWSVFLEKPPGATLSEVDALAEIAADRGVQLFASWHSRFAPAVEPARAWLAARTPRRATITWKEDVRHWHPGQEWIFAAGGLGVFDPAINAFSIATAILPRRFWVKAATLHFPENRQAPIAAEVDFTGLGGLEMRAELDFLQTGPQTWDIEVQTDDGVLLLSRGGSVMTIDGAEQSLDDLGEYPGLYARFAELLKAGRSEVDVAPLRHVADAFMLGERTVAAPFSY